MAGSGRVTLVRSPYQYGTDIVLLVVRWCLQYALSLRDLTQLFLEWGIAFTHEAVRAWEERFAPLLAARRAAGKAAWLAMRFLVAWQARC